MDIENNKKVHVIGATGHIGSYLCPYLSQNGYCVTGYHRGVHNPYTVFDSGNVQVNLKRMYRVKAVDNAINEGADVICDLIPYTVEDVEHICNKILNADRRDEIQ